MSAAHMIHARTDERRGLCRIAAVAIAHTEIRKRRKIRRHIAARRLHVTSDGNSEAVIFDVKQHRKFERRGDGQRRPEAAGRHTRITADGDGNRAVVRAIGE